MEFDSNPFLDTFLDTADEFTAHVRERYGIVVPHNLMPELKKIFDDGPSQSRQDILALLSNLDTAFDEYEFPASSELCDESRSQACKLFRERLDTLVLVYQRSRHQNAPSRTTTSPKRTLNEADLWNRAGSGIAKSPVKKPRSDTALPSVQQCQPFSDLNAHAKAEVDDDIVVPSVSSHSSQSSNNVGSSGLLASTRHDSVAQTPATSDSDTFLTPEHAPTPDEDPETCLESEARKPSKLRVHNVAPAPLLAKLCQAQPDGRRAVPWGVQYYLASMVSFGLVQWSDLNVTSGLNLLRSDSNVESMMTLFSPGNQAKIWDQSKEDMAVMSRQATRREVDTYAELDRETKMLEVNRLNGVLGPPGEDFLGYGGRVIFDGKIYMNKLDAKPKKGAGAQNRHREFYIKLFPPRLGPSTRFTRRFGSEKFIRLKMDLTLAKDAQRFARHPKTREIQQEIQDFLAQTIQIMGRRYRPFLSKGDTIWLVQVEESFPSTLPPEVSCVWDFVDRHSPFEYNKNSSLGKFVQRLLLGISTSVPVSAVEKIEYMEDIFGGLDGDDGEDNPFLMTDGAAPASLAVCQDVAQRLGSPSIPSAFQARIAGAKGVWYLDPDAMALMPGVEKKRIISIRESQRKVNLPIDKQLDLSQTVVDLLVPTRTSTPSTLSKQILMVLHDRGVPVETLAEIQDAELTRVTEEFTNWEGPTTSVCLRLATAINRLCKVEQTKSKRGVQAAEHRAQGMSSHHADATPEFFEDDDSDVFYGQDGRHLWTGKPASKHECAYEMLLAGFHPATCPYLAELLVDVASSAMKRMIGKFAIPILRSAEAIVIPDPKGILEEGEIQFRFSGDEIYDPDTRMRLTHVPEGDVLVTRHPCLLPTDIRKVRAVVLPELSAYVDVVVFSVKGKRPLADLLSGGDYDGDTIRVFWEPKLVEPFENADTGYATCPFAIDDVFDRKDITVGAFLTENGGKGKIARDEALIPHLIETAFEPSVKGLYGVMHLYAAWQWGLQSDVAIELAHKFSQCMDAQKTGLVIKPRVRIDDSKKYLGDLPEWANQGEDSEGFDKHDWLRTDEWSSSKKALLNSSPPESVLCILWQAGKKETSRLKTLLARKVEKTSGLEDKAISSMWKEAVRTNWPDAESLQVIKESVKTLVQCYALTNQGTRRAIMEKNRLRMTRTTSLGWGKGKGGRDLRETRGIPLRRVKSDAAPPSQAQGTSDPSSESDSEDPSGESGSSDACPIQTQESVVSPVQLGSANEVAAKFCVWPRDFAEKHMSKSHELHVENLELLRASCAYYETYRLRPKFAFEMAWKWLINIKAKETGKHVKIGVGKKEKVIQGPGSTQMPYQILDLMALKKKIISRFTEINPDDGDQ